MGAADNSLYVTLFNKKSGTKKTFEGHKTLGQIAGMIEGTRTPSHRWDKTKRDYVPIDPKDTTTQKNELPFISLGEYGDRKSDRHSFRWGGNYLAFNGVEGDHDEGMPLDDILARLRAAGITCLVCHSSSYDPVNKPHKVRILVPLSRSYRIEGYEKAVLSLSDRAAGIEVEYPTKDQLEAFKRLKRTAVDTLNGIVDGELAPESAHVPQGFFYGPVYGTPPRKAFVLDGDYMDLRPDLIANRIPTMKADKAPKNHAPRGAAGDGAAVVTQGYDVIRSEMGDHHGGAGFHPVIFRMISSYTSTHTEDMFDRDWLIADIQARALECDSSRHTEAYILDQVSEGRLHEQIDCAIALQGGMGKSVKEWKEIEAKIILDLGGIEKFFMMTDWCQTQYIASIRNGGTCATTNFVRPPPQKLYLLRPEDWDNADAVHQYNAEAQRYNSGA